MDQFDNFPLSLFSLIIPSSIPESKWSLHRRKIRDSLARHRTTIPCLKIYTGIDIKKKDSSKRKSCRNISLSFFLSEMGDQIRHELGWKQRRALFDSSSYKRSNACGFLLVFEHDWVEKLHKEWKLKKLK